MKQFCIILLAAITFIGCNNQHFKIKQVNEAINYDDSDSISYVSLSIDADFIDSRTIQVASIINRKLYHAITKDSSCTHGNFELCMTDYITKKQKSYSVEVAYNSLESIPTRYVENIIGRVMRNDDEVFNYKKFSYIYLGGAHGEECVEYFNFNPQKGTRIKESDIFIDGFEEKITPILIKYMTDRDGKSTNEFDQKEVKPNGNFLIKCGSIEYYFNHYEIGCYAAGHFKAVLPYSKIESLLTDYGKEAVDKM